MPELPDIELYLHALRPRILDRPLERVRITSPFLVRSVEPPPDAVVGLVVTALGRSGKRIVLRCGTELHLVLHLMIAGRLRWRAPGAAIPGRVGLAAFDFPTGTLLLTEAGTTRRAALHVVRGTAGVAAFDRGGIDPLDADAAAFRAALRRENHTLKRALTDPRIVSGVGNAYSDEILHAARLSPLALTATLDDAALDRLRRATRDTLVTWRDRLIAATGDAFPEIVTAFREGMAVHGRYRQPCPVCGAPVQRIRYAANEVNYCAACQTNGRVLADRAMSRLLREDWPRSLDLWEERMAPRGAAPGEA